MSPCLAFLLRQIDNLGAAVAVVHGGGYLARRLVGYSLQRIIREVRVAFRRARLFMPQYLADQI